MNHGPWGYFLNKKKNEGRKSRDTVPLNGFLYGGFFPLTRWMKFWTRWKPSHWPHTYSGPVGQSSRYTLYVAAGHFGLRIKIWRSVLSTSVHITVFVSFFLQLWINYITLNQTYGNVNCFESDQSLSPGENVIVNTLLLNVSALNS
jgi:hypothetical protein